MNDRFEIDFAFKVLARQVKKVEFNNIVRLVISFIQFLLLGYFSLENSLWDLHLNFSNMFFIHKCRKRKLNSNALKTSFVSFYEFVYGGVRMVISGTKFCHKNIFYTYAKDTCLVSVAVHRYSTQLRTTAAIKRSSKCSKSICATNIVVFVVKFYFIVTFENLIEQLLQT
jgi:hypothetical protein